MLGRASGRAEGARRAWPCLLALAALLMLLPPTAEALQFARGGFWFGWLTGHFTHWSWQHFAWDAAVFAAFSAHLERRARRVWAATLIVGAAAIAAAVNWGLPDIAAYRGLSGLDSALFGLFLVLETRAALAARRRFPLAVWGLVSCGFALKVVYECLSGTAAFVTAASMVPVPLAHGVGFAVGAAVGAAAWAWEALLDWAAEF